MNLSKHKSYFHSSGVECFWFSPSPLVRSVSKLQVLCHEFYADFSVQLNLSYVNFTGDVDGIVVVKDRH